MLDTKSSTPAQTSTCPLLNLPPEIRNRIWTLAAKGRILAICFHCPREYGENLPPTAMSLASTCRQIYREVTPIYYSKNAFHFTSGVAKDSPWQFAAAIGPANAASITFIAILPHAQEWALTQLPFPNLKVLWCFRLNILNVRSSEELSEILDAKHPELYGYSQRSILLRDLSLSNDPTLTPIPMPRLRNSRLSYSYFIPLSDSPPPRYLATPCKECRITSQHPGTHT